MATKKYISLSKLSTFLDNLKTTFATYSHSHTLSDITDYTVDDALSSTSTNPVQNKVLDAEFEAISQAMTAYDAALDDKANVSHSHDDKYYTETEIDTKLAEVDQELAQKVNTSTLESYYTETEVDNLLSGKSDSTHNHNNAYDTKGAASEALTSANSYTDTKTANLASNSAVDTKISTHNTNTEAHNDIRALIDGLTTRLNTLANSTDEDLDQMAEVVAYIKSNKELIEAITTSKVSVDAIVNNLTTNVTNQPLSAAQGVALKGLIDALEAEFDAHGHEIADVTGLQNALNNKANASDLTSHTSNKSNPHGVTLSQLGVTATADELNKMDGVTATTTELNYVDGVTSNIQTQLDGKAASGHTHSNYVPTTRTVNSKALSSNITLSASDVGADASGTASSAISTHNSSSSAHSSLFATKANVSDLTSHIDDTSIHVTSAEKTKLSGIETGAQVNTVKYENDTLKAKVDGAWTEVELGGGGVGKNVEGLSLGVTENYTMVFKTAGVGAEIFNDYRDTVEYGIDGHHEGNSAIGEYSHAEGSENDAIGDYSHAEGTFTQAIGYCSHAEGLGSKASGNYSHAEGNTTQAIGIRSHSEGGWTKASGDNSHAAGYHTTALASQYVIGHYNGSGTAGSTSGTTGDAFIIGKGTSSSGTNAFRITYAGKTFAVSTGVTSGADYAEYFEWVDGNPNNEDRRGYFVTLDGENIKIAEPNDYILGIISGMPAILGNGDENWRGRYIYDEFGAFITEEFEYEEEIFNSKTGESETVTKTGTRYKENPDYDPSLPYVQREDRPEWDAVGMVGVLSVRDDGTCQVNGFCKVAEGGIATASENGYRVIKRINENIVKVVFK